MLLTSTGEGFIIAVYGGDKEETSVDLSMNKRFAKFALKSKVIFTKF